MKNCHLVYLSILQIEIRMEDEVMRVKRLVILFFLSRNSDWQTKKLKKKMRALLLS